jgi:hypothetical protein
VQETFPSHLNPLIHEFFIKNTVTPIQMSKYALSASETQHIIKNRVGYPLVKIDTSNTILNLESILKEARSLEKNYVPIPTVNELMLYEKTNHEGWEGLCLRGLSEDKVGRSQFYTDKYMSSDKYQWTSLSEKCPATMNFLNSLNLPPSYRIRFMRLQPGGIIVPHVDRYFKGINESMIILNFPTGCYFCMDDFGYVPASGGDMYIFDSSIAHAVINLSNETRYSLIIHSDIIQSDVVQNSKLYLPELKN